MASQSKISKHLTDAIGYINAGFTLIDTFANPSTNGNPRQIEDWICEGGQLTSTFDILQLLFLVIGRDKWDEWITNKISSTFMSPSGLDKIEQVIKTAIFTALQGYLSCSANPIIPDSLIDGGNGGPKRTSGEGYVIPLSTIDLMGKLYTNPMSTIGKYCYFDTWESETSLKEGNNTYMANLWKSRDFDAFLYYVIHKGHYTGRDKYKCIWDNRYTPPINGEKTDWKSLYGNSESYYEALTPEEVDAYNEGAKNKALRKKKQIARFEYLEGNTYGDGAIRILINDNSYYRKTISEITGWDNKVTENIRINHAMAVWDWDFLQSIRLFNVKTVAAQLIDILYNGATRVTLSLNKSKLITSQIVSQIVENIIRIDDTQIDDCYFSFSNDEYNALLERADLIRRGLMDNGGEVDPEAILASLDNVSDSATLNHDITTLSNIIKTYSKNNDGDNLRGGISIHCSWVLANILKNIGYIFIECLFTPKIMTVIAVNMKYIGKDVENNWNDVLGIIMNAALKIIIEIKDMLVMMLYQYAISELNKIIEQILALRILEQIKDYRAILERLFKLFQLLSKEIPDMDTVNYAEITDVGKENIPTLNKC